MCCKGVEMPIYSADRTCVLETRHSGYALGVNAQGLLVHRYWAAPPIVHINAVCEPGHYRFRTASHTHPNEFQVLGWIDELL